MSGPMSCWLPSREGLRPSGGRNPSGAGSACRNCGANERRSSNNPSLPRHCWIALPKFVGISSEVGHTTILDNVSTAA